MSEACVGDAECGVYPGDTTNRFFTDYQAIYQTASTPNLRNLVRPQPCPATSRDNITAGLISLFLSPQRT